MIELTDRQEELFDIWIKKYLKEYGHDFAFGFYVVLDGTDEYLCPADPKYHEWFEMKKEQFLEEQNKII